MPHHFAKIAFTGDVKAAQERYGTRAHNERWENAPVPATEFSFQEMAFISQRDGFYLATVSETGWPYVQFRGGPPGFLKVLDERTLGYADFRGNRQYISVGNLSGNNRAGLILMDYANRRRLKIYAHIHVADVKDGAELIRRLEMPSYKKAKIERTMILTLEAFDWNCPAHITPRFTEQELEILHPAFAKLRALEAENQALKAKLEAAHLQKR